MDALRAFVEEAKKNKLTEGHFRGYLHILIGRNIVNSDGTPVSGGMTWRELAAMLKKCRWSKDAVNELDLNLEELAQRDRERFWYMVIARAEVDSEAAVKDGDRLADILKVHGYAVGPAPGKTD